MTNLKRGQRVFLKGWSMDGQQTLEPATIVRKVPMTHYADGSDYPGWYLVAYEYGGRGVNHVSRMTLGNY